jgi:hypothetical protein
VTVVIGLLAPLPATYSDKILNREKNDSFDICKANPDLFNKYFLMIAEKNTYNICSNTKIATNNIKNPIHYLTQTFQNSFPKIKFNYTSAKEIENNINSVPLKNSHGYDEILMKILKKLVLPVLVLLYVTFVIKPYHPESSLHD